MMVSVIVPVYNVVSYLQRCVDSIISQTYVDLEIVLVDDGSTDGCSNLCDEFAIKDSRIVVLHQANMGLSAARNAGIDIAKGEYLVFVDSDDWIHPQYVEILLGDMENLQCKMAIGEMKKCGNIVGCDAVREKAVVLSKEEAIPRMLKGEWVSAWAKMFHRSLFDDVRFPVGRNNEDYAILIYLFEKCENICYTKSVVYYYFVREGSISRSSLNDHSFDEVINGKEVWKYCKLKYPQWSGLALFNLTASIIKLTGKCLMEDKYLNKYEEMRDYFMINKGVFLTNPELAIKYKIFLWAMMIGKPFHKGLMTIYSKK